MERLVAVLAQEVIQAEPQPLKNHTDMVAVLKPLPQVHTVVEPLWIICLESVENFQLPSSKKRLFGRLPSATALVKAIKNVHRQITKGLGRGIS